MLQWLQLSNPNLHTSMNERITINPAIHFGKPCVAGTRIPVQDVLELIKQGCTFDQIIKDYYPDLRHADLQACLQFAMDVLAAETIHVTTNAA
jgi:uncharacterized protein (DUF433 family)